jgi:hypothetical protein
MMIKDMNHQVQPSSFTIITNGHDDKDCDKNSNNNNNDNNSSNNRKRKADITKDTQESKDIIDNSFLGRNMKHNYNPYNQNHSHRQIFEGEDFHDAIIVCYDRNVNNPGPTQRDLSFGIMFIRNLIHSRYEEEDTLSFIMHDYDSDAYINGNMECYGASSNETVNPKFKIPVKQVHIKSSNMMNRGIFGTHDAQMGVCMYPMNDFSQNNNDLNSDYRYHVEDDSCDIMGFYYIVDASNISNFNRETRRERVKLMSNYSIVNPTEAWIGNYISQNFNVLTEIIHDIEDDFADTSNILDTNFLYNTNVASPMKPRKHDSDPNNLLIAPFRYYEYDEDPKNNITNSGKGNSSNKEKDNSNNSSNNTKMGHCKMIKTINPNFSTKITIETNLPSDQLSNIFHSKRDNKEIEGSNFSINKHTDKK